MWFRGTFISRDWRATMNDTVKIGVLRHLCIADADGKEDGRGRGWGDDWIRERGVRSQEKGEVFSG